ncbi:MAG: glycosyltransferase family 4 protein [bacterium]
MNIWIFNHYATTPNYPGGTRHYDLSKELVKKGHRVTIFASSFHYLLLSETKSYNKNRFIVEEIEGIRFIWIKTPAYRKSDLKRVINMLVYSYNSLLSALEVGKLEKPDVVIGSSVHLFAPLIAYFISKKFKVPFIFEVRDLWPKALIDLGVSPLHPFIIILSIIERFLYKKAHKIITLLPNSYQYMKNFKVEDKLIWIPNGIDDSRIKSIMENEARTYSNSIKIAYAGAMGRGNDIQVIFDIAKKIRSSFDNVKIHIIGGGYNKKDLIEKLSTQDSQVREMIKIEEAVPKNKIYHKLLEFDILLYHVADVFKYGISSNKIFDYLAVGKPIIFFADVPNNIVEEAQAGVTVKNIDQIPKAIEYIISLPENELKEMSKRARDYVLQNYSITVLADKLEKVIKEVCDNFAKN